MSEEKVREYPYIGVHPKGMWVLFSKKNTGVLLNDCTDVDEELKATTESKKWIEEEFTLADLPTVDEEVLEQLNSDNEIIVKDDARDWIYAPFKFVAGGSAKGVELTTYALQTDKGTTVLTVAKNTESGKLSTSIVFIPEARIITHDDGTKSIK